MRPGRGLLSSAIIFALAVSAIPCFMNNAEAFRRGEAVEGPRGGEAVEGPRGGEAVEGPRGGEAVEGPRGNVGAEGPRGNIAVGTRFNSLPASARPLYVGDRNYYVDGSGVYYLPCADDGTVYCVVSAPK
jgi:hypothetical protein